VTQSHIRFKEFDISHIYNKRLKKSIISINEYGDITLKTPYKNQKKILSLFQEKEQWLRDTLKKAKLRKKPKLPDEIELFGEIIPAADTSLVYMLKRLRKKDQKSIEQAYSSFYKNLAKEYLPQRVAYFEQKMQLKCKDIRFRKMRRRWGSCSKDGVITFNTNLLKRDKAFIDEVVVHELAHLVHFNHSKAFHQLVANYTK